VDACVCALRRSAEIGNENLMSRVLCHWQCRVVFWPLAVQETETLQVRTCVTGPWLRRLATAEPRVRARVSLHVYGTCSGQSNTRTGFSPASLPSVSVIPPLH
jgi:hypothetical protein